MGNLQKLFYLITLCILLVVLLGEENSTFSNAYSLENEENTKQIVETNKQKNEPGQVPEKIFKSQKLSQLKQNKKLNLVISFDLEKEQELRKLISELYLQNSPNYHKWLSPEEFGEKFGRSESEINLAIEWLTSQGFNIEETWPNRLAISFSASVNTIEKVFQVEMSEYKDDSNRVFYSNSQAPKLPKALKSMISNIYGLNNAYLYKTNSKLRPFSTEQQKLLKDSIKTGKQIGKNFQVGNSPIFFGPDDFSLAYNIDPISTSGIQGQGQRVAIIINSNVLDDDINFHRQLFGLPFAINIKRFVPPGLEMPPVRFQGEAELDIDSVSLIAPMAEINLVLIPELTPTNVFLAEQFIINTLKIPIVSESFGGCEAAFFSTSEQMLMLQGVAQGMAFFVASGDEGAECFPGGTSGQTAINCPACYDGATAVGGTQIIGDYDFFGDLVKVRQESVWNEAPGVRFDCDGNPLNSGGATGGGISQKVSRPNYQTMASDFINGVPAGNKRVIPDIALLAGAPGTAIIVNSNGFIAFGTSQSAPLWAGIMALINQVKGAPQGSPNSEIYRLGKDQFNNSGPGVFRDITFGNNNTSTRVPCAQIGAKGFLASRGYDLVTGWGVPDVELLVKNFAPDKIPPVVKVTSPTSGDTFKIADKIRIDWQTTDSSAITRHDIDLSTDAGATFPIKVSEGLAGNAQNFIFTIPNTPNSQARIRVTATDELGNKGFGVSQGNFSIVTPIQPGFTLSVSPSLQTVVAGNSTNFSISTENKGDFRGEVSLSVMVEPANNTIKITAPKILVSAGNRDLLQIDTTTASEGDFKITLVGTAKSSSGDQLASSTSTILRVIQPDFSLTFDSPELKITRGQKLSFPVIITRTANFAGKVTVTAPNLSALKLNLTPSSQSTLGNSLSFLLKAKKSGPIGRQELIFTGQDDLGRIRTGKINLLIE